MDPTKAFQEILPEITPFLVAIALASLVILISNAMDKSSKVMFQAILFGSAMAASVTYLITAEDVQLVSVWQQFVLLSNQMRFCLSVFVVAAVYFGGAMYIAAPDEEDESKSNQVSNVVFTPASCDKVIGFEVPASIPSDGTVFFEQMFNKLCKEVVADLPTTYELPDENFKWLERMLQYTVAGGKMNRGLATYSVRKTFASSAGKTLTNKEHCQAAALGWCVEFLQAFFLVADDVMDDSVTRRGQPCWFRNPEVKLIAINDSFILESFVYKILKLYFGDEPYYGQLVDLFVEVTRQTELGQLLDLTSQPLEGPIDLTRFTLERYTGIVKYKTAFYSFYLPVALGMIVSGIKDAELFEVAREILLIMGEYFQVQDDYLDNFGTPEVIGKIGTDIQDNKCSWLVVQALQRCNAKQRKVLEDNYGKNEPTKINKVKKLYDELGLKEIFEAYEEESYASIQMLLGKVEGKMPKEVFTFLLGKIYKRSK